MGNHFPGNVARKWRKHYACGIHRIYKSLDFEDFLEETSFIMAKGGMDCLPYIQDANCLKKTTPEKALKQFVKSILMAVHTYCPNISIKDDGRYYSVTIEKK